MRRYRSVVRRRGYVYLYVFEEMPGVFPRPEPPADGAGSPAGRCPRTSRAAAYAETRRAVDGERAAITRAAAAQRELSEVKLENLALRAVLRPQAQQVVVAQQAARHVAAQQAQIAARAY